MQKHSSQLTNLSRKNIQELTNIFGYSGVGYYYAIIEEIIKQDKLLFPKSKLNKLSRKTKINRRTIKNIIKTCTQLYNSKGNSLLSENKDYIWSNEILSEYYNAIKKKKAGGRAKISKYENIKIKDAEFVNLTKQQYEKLLDRYGYTFTSKALQLLNNLLKQNTKKSESYKNRNNYWLFRSDSWLIRETKLALENNYII